MKHNNTETAAIRLTAKTPRVKPREVTPAEMKKTLKKKSHSVVVIVIATILMLAVGGGFITLALLAESFSLKLPVILALIITEILLWSRARKKYLNATYYLQCFFFEHDGAKYAISETIADNVDPVKVKGRDYCVKIRYFLDSFSLTQAGMKRFYSEQLQLADEKDLTFVAIGSSYDRDFYTFEVMFYTAINDRNKVEELIKSRCATNMIFYITEDPDWTLIDCFRPTEEDIDRTFVSDVLRFLKKLSVFPDETISFSCTFAFSDSDEMAKFLEDGEKNGFTKIHSVEKKDDLFCVHADYASLANRPSLLGMVSHLRKTSALYKATLTDKDINYGDIFNILRKRENARPTAKK